jgi:type VI secretion system protein VasJ
VTEAALLVDTALLAPISDAAPAGRDLTYEAPVEQIAAELEKATALTGERPNWGLIARESFRLLREETKDLRIASWWVVAVAQVDGWGPVARAIDTYGALVQQFWPAMYPPINRLRARAALVSWLWENLARSLAAREVANGDAESLRVLEAGIARLDAAIGERLGEASPSAGALRSVLREKSRTIPEPAAPLLAASPTMAPAQWAAVRVPDAPEAVAAPSTLDDAQTAADRWRDPLGTLARGARLAAPTSPWPYRLARISAWLTIEGAPAVENGKTFVRGPRGDDRTGLAHLFESGAWEALRDAAEDALLENIFWLDVHRYAALALERLGPAYAAARITVAREAAGVVMRIPVLPSLLFSNGTPFASPETVDWLLEQRGLSAASEKPRAVATDELEGVIRECEGRIASGQLEEALAQALASTRTATVPARFRARLRIAQLAHRSGKGDIAVALLEALLHDIDPTLEAWEPSVCAEVLETLLKALRSLSSEGGDRQALLFRRLLSLDPAAAMRIGG